MTAYFLSDIHLKSAKDPKYEKLLAFLQEVFETASEEAQIFLLGDIFDLWIADHHYFKKEYHALIAMLKKIQEKGLQVHYFEGNHDLYLKKFWQDQLGFDVHEDVYFTELDTLKIRMEHGDLANPHDKGYLFLRKFLRHPGMKKVAHSLPGKVVHYIGNRASRVSRDYTSQIPVDKKKVLRTYAEKLAREDDFDLLITGHLHISDDYVFYIGSREVRSINLGTWLERPVALKIENGDFTWIDIH